MSSTESSGAPAEATATTPAPAAEFPTFGSTRGSGLARGKRPSTGPATAPAPAATDYKPTAIEVVTTPREYQNPFAPAETPVAATESVAAVAPAPAAPAPVAPVKIESAPAAETVSAPAPVQPDEPAELNILEAEQKKTAPAQTWESEGFRPAREPRGDRPRREEPRRDEPRREENAPVDIASIPEKFLYVRPGVTYTPTPSNYGGAPRERHGNRAATEAPASAAAEAPVKSGGFFGWLKSLFGSSSAATPAPAGVHSGEHRHGDRHHGGRGRGQGGGDGQRRRHRGGRGRSRGEFRGGDQGSRSGGPAN